MRLAAILIFPIFSQLASAADILVEWTAPTTRIDGSPIVSLDGYRLYVSHDNVAQPVLTIDPSASSYTIMDIEPGHYVVSLSAAENGLESERSDPAALMIGEVEAALPGKVVITIEVTGLKASNLKIIGD